MKRPVVGVIGSAHLVENRFPAQRVGERNLMAVADVVGALPLIFAGDPAPSRISTPCCNTVDGVLLTGARANVHPDNFGAEAHPKYEPYDRRRDARPCNWSKPALRAACPCSAFAAASRK